MWTATQLGRMLGVDLMHASWTSPLEQPYCYQALCRLALVAMRTWQRPRPWPGTHMLAQGAPPHVNPPLPTSPYPTAGWLPRWVGWPCCASCSLRGALTTCWRACDCRRRRCAMCSARQRWVQGAARHEHIVLSTTTSPRCRLRRLRAIPWPAAVRWLDPVPARPLPRGAPPRCANPSPLPVAVSGVAPCPAPPFPSAELVADVSD